jgi:hypothetical protein
MTLPTVHPIDRILADPMIRAVMKADGIEVAEMKSLLCNVRRRLTTPVVDDSGLFNAGGADNGPARYGALATADAGRLVQGPSQSW